MDLVHIKMHIHRSLLIGQVKDIQCWRLIMIMMRFVLILGRKLQKVIIRKLKSIFIGFEIEI